MKTIRAILVGAFVWLFVFSAFTALSYLPGIKDSEVQQGIIVAVFLIPFAYWGASIFYKNGNNTNGLMVGLIMVITALILDAFITVPFIIIPLNGSYQSFYTNPILWILVSLNMATIYFYWKTIVITKPQNSKSIV